MKINIGTRSILFGVHQLFLHPIFVAIAWKRLYGFPKDPRLWACFFLHDVGYLGRSNMDGQEGEAHVELGARIVGRLFDGSRFVQPWWARWFFGAAPTRWRRPSRYQFFGLRVDRSVNTWEDLSMFHSRFYARAHDRLPSRLCFADKLSFATTPRWLYLLLARASGELDEYMKAARSGKYAKEQQAADDPRDWYDNVKRFVERYCDEMSGGNKIGS